MFSECDKDLWHHSHLFKLLITQTTIKHIQTLKVAKTPNYNNVMHNRIPGRENSYDSTEY